MMDSKTTYEQEIDLKDLMFAVLRKWRGILIVAVIFAVILGGFKGVQTYRAQNDEEKLENQQKKYADDVKAFQKRKETLEREIKNLETDISNQQEYLENSILINMSPYDYCEARADLFIKTDYTIMPGMVYQNVDYTDTILLTYQSVMTSTSFLDHIANEMGIKVKYLKELVSIDRGNKVLTITVKHGSQKDADKVLKKLLEGIDTLHTQIIESIGEHTVNLINQSIGSTVNLSLEDRQRQESQRLINLQDSLTAKQETYEEMEEPEEPASEFMNIVKNGVKYAVLGAVLGSFMIAFFVCVAFLMSDKVYSSKEIRTRFPLKVLGVLPARIAKKKNSIDDLLDRLEGRPRNINEEKEYELIAANIRNYSSEVKNLLVTGSISEDRIAQVKERLSEQLPDLTIVSTGNMLQKAEALKKLPECDGVVLVEQANTTVYGVLSQEIEKIVDLKKEIVGFVVFE